MLVATSAGGAVALTSTTTTIIRTGVDSPGAMGMTGYVSPAPPQGGEKVTVKLLRKTADGWVLVDKRRPALSDATGEGAAFTTTLKPAPAKGTCKVTAKYPGDATYAKSHAAKVVYCKTGQPKS